LSENSRDRAFTREFVPFTRESGANTREIHPFTRESGANTREIHPFTREFEANTREFEYYTGVLSRFRMKLVPVLERLKCYSSLNCFGRFQLKEVYKNHNENPRIAVATRGVR
jgi:hypothetical protein